MLESELESACETIKSTFLNLTLGLLQLSYFIGVCGFLFVFLLFFPLGHFCYVSLSCTSFYQVLDRQDHGQSSLVKTPAYVVNSASPHLMPSIGS